MIVDGSPETMHVTATCLGESYDLIRRKLLYPVTDIFLICFSVVRRVSFDEVSRLWMPDLEGFTSTVPFILLGTHIDLRDNGNPDHVSKEEGLAEAKKIGAVSYLECSVETGQGVREAFEEAVRVVHSAGNINSNTAERTGGKCILM